MDIGANDGTLLKYFKKDKMITIGCEPANNLQKELKKTVIIESMISGTQKLNKIPLKHRKLKVITAIECFMI